MFLYAYFRDNNKGIAASLILGFSFLFLSETKCLETTIYRTNNAKTITYVTFSPFLLTDNLVSFQPIYMTTTLSTSLFHTSSLVLMYCVINIINMQCYTYFMSRHFSWNREFLWSLVRKLWWQEKDKSKATEQSSVEQQHNNNNLTSVDTKLILCVTSQHVLIFIYLKPFKWHMSHMRHS